MTRRSEIVGGETKSFKSTEVEQIDEWGLNIFIEDDGKNVEVILRKGASVFYLHPVEAVRLGTFLSHYGKKALRLKNVADTLDEQLGII